MSVIEFHIWPEDNPVGEANKLGVITDEDVVLGEGGPAIWYEPSLHGLGGSAGFSISRHSALAMSTIIREDNFVRVKVPEISSDYLPFGWWMKTGEFHLIDSDEAGGENITIEGPGLLHKLATGSLYHSSTVSDQPNRGSANRQGLWWWTNEPWGAILTRIMEEGRHAPYPDPAAVGSPLEFFDITYSRTEDSAAVDWPILEPDSFVLDPSAAFSVIETVAPNGYSVGDRVIFTVLGGGAGLVVGRTYWVWDIVSATAFRVSETEGGPNAPASTDITSGTIHAGTSNEFQVDIGTDLMTVADRLRESGNLYIIGDASDVDALTVHCYQTYGDDLTGSFGAVTVRFEKGVNIATELVRRSEAGLRINKLLLRDKDGYYSTETLPGFSAGDVEQWGFWDANQTNDDTLLNAIGRNVLLASQTSVEAIGFEAPPGKAPTDGLYLPDLHYKPGDTVTVHTGTDPEDYDEADQIVMAVKVSVRDGTTDDTSVHAQRSLKIEPQLNYYSPRYGNSNVGTGPMGVAGCRCLGLCSALTPGTETASRLYFTSAATPLAGSAGWTGGTSDMDTKTLAFTPSGVGGTHTSWDAVNQAAASFGLVQGRITLSNAALLAAVQDGGTFRIQAMIGCRHGIGIDESAHREYLDGCVRVWRPSTTSFIGTMLAVGDATSAIHAENDTAGTIENRSMGGALTGVPSAIATDVLVVELGLEHTAPTTGGAGGSVRAYDSDGVDLPEDDTTSTVGNAWVELRTVTAPTGTGNHPDLVGTDTSAARCDHKHHIVSDRAPEASDNIDQGYPDTTLWTDTETGLTYLLIDEDAGTWILVGAAGEHTHTTDEIEGLEEVIEETGGSDSALQHGGFIATYHRASDGRAMVMYSDDGITFRDGALIELNSSRRDPSLIHWDGKYWVVLTHGSTSLRLYESPDLETWTGPSTITVDAGATQSWAPEWIRNMDGTPYLHPSTGLPCATVNVSTDSETTFTIREIHPTNRAMTTWSSPVTITGTGLPTDAIDAFLLADGDDYWLWAHDESSQTILVMQGTALTSGYTVLESGDWAGWLANIDPAASGIEGPCLVRLDDGRWRIYFNENDGFDSIRAVYSETTDDWRTGTSTWIEQAEIQTDVLMGHGSVTFVPSVYDHLRDPNAHADIAGVSDHGALGGLSDDDHPQYILHTEMQTSGHYELIVSGSGPPVAVTNEAADDFLYGWIAS